MTGFVFAEKPIQIERGEGVYVYDADGTEYLDFGASYACAPLGHCHPEVLSATTEQLQDLFYIQASYPNSVRTALYNQLAAVAPGDINNVWLCNSGTEANEAGLKFARHATGRSKIISTMRGFHGRTMGALAATWKNEYRDGFEPLASDFAFVPYGDEDAMIEEIDADTAGVILEPVQGEGGIHQPDASYVQAVREATDDVGAALILDEIQTGLGRTGSMWATEQANVVPDILTTAKGLASGLPMGATLVRDWIAEDAGSHASTFSGGPAICAAAGTTVSIIERDNLPDHVADVSEYLITALHTRLGDEVRDIRGSGLMVGIEVRRGANTILRDLALNHQVLALPAGRSVVRLLPPLVITEAHVESVIDALEAVIG